MASLLNPAPQLLECTPYCTIDPVLGPILVFYSSQPSGLQSIGSQPSLPLMRIEAHVFSCAGFHSYPRLVLSQSSPLYAAVNHLPPHCQHSETYRGLAVAVLKYFSELSKSVKETIIKSNTNGEQVEEQAVAFDEMHAGDLAARLKVVDSETVAADLECALKERFVSSMDVDIVLRSRDGSEVKPDAMPLEVERLLDLFGDPTHLPFAKLKRAPSKPASAMVRPKALADPREALNRELEELRHTEENYLAKLLDLWENVAKPMKESRASKKADSSSPSLRDLDALFPPSLERIIEVNSAFLDGIETGGIEDVASCCVTHFPNFRKPYEDYLRASADFPQLLAKFTKDKHSSFSKRVQQTGEQKLRSLIIEPVQRLPRYSLLIDNMINYLSADDPTLGPLNDARDMITEICSLQTSETEERSATIKRLQSLVVSWPASLKPSGRLITAIDFYDILPPYNNETSEAIPSILLLFPDCVVILRRPNKHSLLARSVMAEVDRPAGGSNYGSGSKRDSQGHDLQFAGWIDIDDVRVSSSDHGTALWMTLTSSLRDSWDVRAGGLGIRKMQLWNAYEGRAIKVEEEFAKAKLERRAAGNTQGLVGVREGKAEGLTFWSCVWGSESRYTSKPKKGSTVIYIDTGESTGKTGKELVSSVGKEGVDIAVGVDLTKDRRVRIETRSWSAYSSTDTVSPGNVLTAFAKRMSSLLRLHSSMQHPPITAALISANSKLLKSLGIPFDLDGKSSKIRAPSPTKLFSTFRGSNASDRPSTAPQSPQNPRKLVIDRSTFLTPTPNNSPERPTIIRGSTVQGLVEDEENREAETIQRITMATNNPLRKLEDTFEAFVNSLKNIATTDEAEEQLRSLHDLSRVDRDAAEVLLGLLISNPKEGRIDKNASVDVVFVAFSKFLQHDWKDGMGSIVDQKTIEELQTKSETLFPGDFEDYFRQLMLEWTPQNKRAFRTIVLLLKEMQSKVTEDDVKGVLTKAFTELLVGDGANALEYLSLMDRFVDNSTALFSEAPPAATTPEGTLVYDPLNGTFKRTKSNSVTNMSIASTSSIRRRFGLSHHSLPPREGKLERHSSDEPIKPTSVWRTLSKSSRESVKDSWKGHLGRSRSTDSDSGRPLPSLVLKKASSGERTSVLSTEAFDSLTPANLTPAKQLRPLSTIMQSPNTGISRPQDKPLPAGPPTPTPTAGPSLRRTKRRSSLSDLHGHASLKPVDGDAVPSLDSARQTLEDKLAALPSSEPYERRKGPSSVVSDTAALFSDKSGSLRRERRDLPLRKAVATPNNLAAPQRLKMPSQQRIRERLQNDHQAITNVEAGLLEEIDRIGEELNGALKPQRSGAQYISKSRDLPPRPLHIEKSTESARADVMRREFQAMLQRKEDEMEAMRRDMKAVLDKKAEEMAMLREISRATIERKDQELKDVEKLVNDCQEENDVMFEKFNEELGKIAAAFKQGKAERELMEILQDSKTDQGRLKRENMKLRREKISMQAQLDGGPGPG